jgi:hypothetical protein
VYERDLYVPAFRGPHASLQIGILVRICRGEPERYRCDRVLTEENADLIFVCGDNSVQDMIPCVIENGLVVSELCAT